MDNLHALGAPVQPSSTHHAALLPLAGGSVHLEGGFWGERQLRNREVTIPHGIEMLEEWGSLDNLRLAAGKSHGEYKLPLFMDSDVYKVLEAIAWDRQRGPVPAHERFFEEATKLIAEAQAPDGYINSYVQVVQQGKRFADPAMGHELYCAGHLFQAAVAEARSGRQEPLLGPVADRFARYLAPAMAERPTFVPGHPEVEMALVEYYRQDGRPELFQLASELVGRRGHSTLSSGSFRPEYFQDDVPLVKADKVRGHAVRALYLLCGATDLFIETGRRELLEACVSQWHDMVGTKMYITGGVGSRHKDESFGEAFELPPDRAYCETCAAVASFMWNWRMTLATGEARYAELAERVLYNGILDGWGLDGKSFFYVNALQSRAGAERQGWYRVACCPPNLMRLMASLQHYVASRSCAGIQIHQFMPATISMQLPGGAFRAHLETAYPWDGWIELRVEEAPSGELDLALRVPSFAGDFSVELNGASEEAGTGRDGYAHLRRSWRAGDEIAATFSLHPRVVWPDPRIDAVRGCVALERGPFVYCFEPAGPDSLTALVTGVPIKEREGLVGSERVTQLACLGRAFVPPPPPPPPAPPAPEPAGANSPYYQTFPGHPAGELAEIVAIPYYAWANRAPMSMRVWAPEIPG